MNAVRLVRMMGELSGLPPDVALERTHQTLFYVGLGEARYRTIDTYSQGMRQMVKLAQALVHGPKLLFLDEPTNGLDPPARQRMLARIREIRDSGQMHLIISSHLLRDVESCCTDVLVLKEGRIAVYCDLAAERRQNRRFLQLELRGDVAAFSQAMADLGCEVARAGGQRLKLVVPDGVAIRDLYLAADRLDLLIRRLDYRRDSLEDIFFKAMAQPDGEAASDGQPSGPDAVGPRGAAAVSAGDSGAGAATAQGGVRSGDWGDSRRRSGNRGRQADGRS
jgi:ABC-2 type transport system ATP-binding protein